MLRLVSDTGVNRNEIDCSPFFEKNLRLRRLLSTSCSEAVLEQCLAVCEDALNLALAASQIDMTQSDSIEGKSLDLARRATFLRSSNEKLDDVIRLLEAIGLSTSTIRILEAGGD